MLELKKKFDMVSYNMSVEICRENRKLFNGKLKDADLTEYKKFGDIETRTLMLSVSKEELFRQDKIL